MIENKKAFLNLVCKLIIILQVVILPGGCTEVTGDEQDQDRIDDPVGWELIWSDEFAGDIINPMLWEHEVNGWGGGNNELQYYTDRSENSLVNDGVLKIIAREEEYTDDDGTRSYTSARLRTRYRGDWLYGRFEIRAKLPVGQGLWPAIWMLPTDWVYGGWPLSGEIDIMELIGHDPSTVHGTLHYGNQWPNNSKSGDSYTIYTSTFDSQFHTFAVEWDTTEFRWYVDDQHYQTQDSWFTPAAEYPAPFDQRFHLLLNVAVGGNWPGNPDSTSVFPQTMEVDYVRVYRKATD